MSNSPYKDQSFYLLSPYRRADNQELFASELYPYCLTSIGFPSMMASVATRLDSSATYEWSDSRHAYIHVTYNGKSSTYGGQGTGEGQGIDKSDIKQYFTFGANGTKLTLDSIKKLLNDYGSLQIKNDVPKEGALTWKSLYDTVGSGSWVKLNDMHKGGVKGFTYLYQAGDGTYFESEQILSQGNEYYWSGDLGYASDAWVDGRYIDSYEMFVMGEKFADHPTSDIIIKDHEVPKVKFKYNPTSGQYEIEEITLTKKTVKFYYYKAENAWYPPIVLFDDGFATFADLENLVNCGVLEREYLDRMILTPDEVNAMQVDKNTNTLPGDFYYYDGTCKPGSKNN